MNAQDIHTEACAAVGVDPSTVIVILTCWPEGMCDLRVRALGPCPRASWLSSRPVEGSPASIPQALAWLRAAPQMTEITPDRFAPVPHDAWGPIPPILRLTE